MNVASAASAEALRVRLCFFVKVLNASGRSVGGGRRVGKMVGICGLNAGGGGGGLAACGAGMRRSGVANAGDDEGAASVGRGRLRDAIVSRSI